MLHLHENVVLHESYVTMIAVFLWDILKYTRDFLSDIHEKMHGKMIVRQTYCNAKSTVICCECQVKRTSKTRFR